MEERFIPFTDEIFKYTGVWQSDNGKEIISYHTAAQLEFGFKGDIIKLKAKMRLSEYIKFLLDGKEINCETENDDVLVIKTEDSFHTLKIIMSRHSKFRFWGVYLNENTELLKTENNKIIVSSFDNSQLSKYQIIPSSLYFSLNLSIPSYLVPASSAIISKHPPMIRPVNFTFLLLSVFQ